MLLPELNDSSRVQLEREDLNGNTRLTGAILFGTKQSVKYYLDLGANLNTENKFGKTPLLHAIDIGDEEIVELLIQYGGRCALRK
jgi:ankyrin repeat protein